MATRQAWKTLSLTGTILIAIGLATGYFDYTTDGAVEWISDHFDIFILALMVGTLFTFVGLIGWSRFMDQRTNVKVAALVFFTPWIMLLVSYLAGVFSFHGSVAFVIMLVFPASILTVILLAMSEVRSRV